MYFPTEMTGFFIDGEFQETIKVRCPMGRAAQLCALRRTPPCAWVREQGRFAPAARPVAGLPRPRGFVRRAGIMWCVHPR